MREIRLIPTHDTRFCPACKFVWWYVLPPAPQLMQCPACQKPLPTSEQADEPLVVESRK